MATTEPIERESQKSKPQLIERPRLLEKLESSDARIIALIAPAGCGKTTLARQWVTSCKIAHAWYSVGPEGFDVAAVAARLAKTVSEVVPEAGTRMLTRLSVSSNPEAEAVLLAELLADELAAWPRETWLVIDDYQALALSHACERFVGTLVREAPLRLLVTSRARPSWGSSRRRLYGELFEIGRDELQMTPEEAREVLAPIASEKRRAQLVELCHGWPAVLGLAARSRSASPPKDALLTGLFDYFAEELYQDASPDLQRFLCQISAAPCLTRDLLERLGGAAALELAETAESSGFFHSGSETGERSLHPLLRAFLKHRLDERRDRTQLVSDLAEALLASERWDDVWQLIQDCNRPDLLPRLIECSLPTLLDGSRVPALESWTELGREKGVASPLLDLAEAEIAFLAGDHTKAYALALQATYHFDNSDPLRWRAHAIAGRSAHFADHLDVALVHLTKARTLAPSRSAIQHCLWTRFLCAYELESEECVSLFEQLESYQDGRPETLVRVGHAALLLSNLVGLVPDETVLLENAQSLLGRVHPQVRTSFIVAYSDYLVRLARYSEAEAKLSEAWTLLADHAISVGVPVFHCVRAANEIGLRRYRHAELLLDTTERITVPTNGSIQMSIRCLRDVIALVRIDRPNDLSATSTDDSAARCWQSLATSIDALKWACHGDLEVATTRLSVVGETVTQKEAAAITVLARTIVAHRSNAPNTTGLFTDALAFISKYRQWNSFVWAYRAYPKLLSLAAAAPSFISQIESVLASAHDERLAERFGIQLRGARRQTDRLEARLSRREKEVLQLVADGLSNKEVARELFISEVTVKVHLRHIYEKLGVRNRTEAAHHALYSD